MQYKNQKYVEWLNSGNVKNFITILPPPTIEHPLFIESMSVYLNKKTNDLFG